MRTIASKRWDRSGTNQCPASGGRRADGRLPTCPAPSVHLALSPDGWLTQFLNRITRVRELLFLIRHHVRGTGGVLALLRCYAATFRDPMSPEPVTLSVRLGATCRDLHMRATDIYTVAEVFRERQYELSRPLGERPVIVDAGANIGVASTWFLLTNPDARVIAIEPIFENASWLSRNVGGEARVSVIQAALGAGTGQVVMTLADHGAEHAVGGVAGTPRTETVACRRLDEILKIEGVSQIDLLKLDVEGSEIDVLLGLGERLEDVRVIVAEVHEHRIDVEAFYALLAAHRFTVVRRRYYLEGEANGVHTVEAWRE